MPWSAQENPTDKPPEYGQNFGKGTVLLTPQQAWSCILTHTTCLPATEVSAGEGFGHVLAEPVLADRNMPPADRSAKDGFAVRAADLRRLPVTLPIIGEVAAGSSAAPVVTDGTCARIFTGANLPPGADTVVQVEDTRSTGAGEVTVVRAEQAGANILRLGENARAGRVLVRAGCVLGSLHLAVAAAIGRTSLYVFRQPRVAIIATGRELRPPEAEVGVHQERDSNGPMLTAAFRAAGFPVASTCRVSDDLDAVTAALREALAVADAVVLSGGVSVGAYDFVPAAVTAVGASPHVHGVAMKPGKPFLFATAPDSRLVFGLPGNPLSAATTLHEFVLPALRRMAGWPEAGCRPLVRARLREAIANQPGRQRYVLATLEWNPSGPEVTPVDSQSSADLASSAGADGAVIVPPDAGGLAQGSLVDFRPWRVWP
jgi:molybdopterin molybdotransferase